MEIDNKRVTGFVTNDKIITVYDESGVLFYLYENPTGETVFFNLPCGFFYSENCLDKTAQPVRYICPTLPVPDKKIVPREMDFRIMRNPSKASIDVATGDVIVDYSIAGKEKPFQCFVYCHEVGHNLYNGGTHEHYCDIFAAKMMLERLGFNPSQIYLAQEFCLSERSVNRKDFLHDYLSRVKKINPKL